MFIDLSEENLHRRSSELFSNFEFGVGDKRVTNPARFLGNTPSAAFVNVISILGAFFAIWSWAERRDDKKKSKDYELDINDLVDEWHGYQNYLKFTIEDMKDIQKQLVCRLDAIYSKSKIISTDCLPYIKPHQPPSAVNKVSSPSKSYSHKPPLRRVDKKNTAPASIYFTEIGKESTQAQTKWKSFD